MRSRDFCYWLQGCFECGLAPGAGIAADQVEVIKSHLALVFKHEIDPSMGNEAHQQQLNKLHGVIGGGGVGGGPVMRC